MDQAKDLVQQITMPETAQQQFDWLAIVTAVDNLCATDEPEVEALLMELLRSPHRIALHKRSPVPFVMPPEQMVKVMVSSRLLNKDAKRFRPIVEEVRDSAVSDTMQERMEQQLQRCGGFS